MAQKYTQYYYAIFNVIKSAPLTVFVKQNVRGIPEKPVWCLPVKCSTPFGGWGYRWWGTDGFVSRPCSYSYMRGWGRCEIAVPTVFVRGGHVGFKTWRPNCSRHYSCSWGFEQTIFSPLPLPWPPPRYIACKVNRQIDNASVKPTHTC